MILFNLVLYSDITLYNYKTFGFVIIIINIKVTYLLFMAGFYVTILYNHKIIVNCNNCKCKCNCNKTHQGCFYIHSIDTLHLQKTWFEEVGPTRAICDITNSFQYSLL